MNFDEGQEKASQIIETLDGLVFTDQLSCCIGVMLSLIIANVPNEPGQQVIANICELLPRQYREGRVLLDAQRDTGTALS